MESKNELGMLLGGFITILVGVVLVAALADNISTLADIDTVNNESVTISSGTGSTANDDLTSLTFFGNATINTDLAGITIDTEVNFTKAGTIIVSQDLNISVGSGHFNGSFAGGSYNVSYINQGVNFVANTTARTLVKLTILFFAIAIMFVGVLIVKKGFAEFM